jgi:hypothetical protein
VSRLAIEHAEPAERPADTEVAPADVGGTPISEATRGQDDLHDEVPHTPPAPAVAGALAQSPRISSQLRRIVFAYTINQLGTWFGYVALAISVYEHTHSAIAVAGLFLAARLLPALLVPAVVARVEASKRRSELSGLYVIEAVATAVLAVLIRHFFLAGVLIFVAIDGTAALAASALLRAAAARVGAQDGRQGLDPGSSPEEVEQASELGSRRAASLLNVAFSTTVAGGPAIAGVVVAAAGASTALVIDAVSFIACSMLLLDIRPHIEAIEDASVRARVATAWQHLRGVPALRTLLVTEALAVVFFASAEPVEVLFAKSTLHAGDGGFGVLVGVWGVGMVIGGLLFARAVKRPLGPLLTGGTLAIGISYVAMGASPTLGYACLAAVVGGVGNGVQWASLITAVQQMTPSALHGRLMAAVESMGSLCPAIGFVVGGAVTALASPRVALIVAGVAAALLTPAFARLSAQGLAPSALAKRSRGVESGSLAS